MTAPASSRAAGASLARLAALIDARCRADGITAGQLAKKAGCAKQWGWAAVRGRAVPAEAHLRLADHLGVDPVTLEPIADGTPAYRGPISWPLVAASVHGRILADRLTVRAVAEAAGVSAATVTRACQAKAISARCFGALAAWCDRHPHEWTLGALHVKTPLKQAETLERAA
jgi:hypothetical protein